MNSVPYERPSWCHICGEKLHYIGNPEHKPEVFVTVAHSDHKEYLYMHSDCWIETVNRKRERKKKKQ